MGLFDGLGETLAWTNPFHGAKVAREQRRKKEEARRKALEDERLRQIYYEAQEARQDRMGKIDYQPVYASELVGKYKKAQSPVAESVLNGFMLDVPRGANSWDPKGTAEVNNYNYEKLFGSPEQLLEQQKTADANVGYDVKTPKPVDTRAITDDGADIRPRDELGYDEWHSSGGKR